MLGAIRIPTAARLLAHHVADATEGASPDRQGNPCPMAKPLEVDLDETGRWMAENAQFRQDQLGIT
jgi:hypothetical protein